MADAYQFTHHARAQMRRYGIRRNRVLRVLASPDQTMPGEGPCLVYQARLQRRQSRKAYLLRVVVDPTHQPPRVVTVYATLKIERYEGAD